VPISPPRLDDRGFHDLVDELLARIPAHTPEWTHPRVGDPGRTIVELFAWLADTILYRANLVPERQRLVFLRLLGIAMAPAAPARGLVAARFSVDRLELPVVLRAGARVGGPPDFETQTELTVLPLEGIAFAKRPLSERRRAEMAPVVDQLLALYSDLGVTGTGRSRPVPYTTEAVFPAGAPARDGFDLIADAVDRSLWIGLFAPPGVAVADARALLAAGRNGDPLIASVGVALATAPIERYDDLPERRPIAHVWEISTTELVAGEPVYRPLDVVRDSTRGLHRDGVVQLALPRDAAVGAPDNDVATTPGAGVGDRPPRIDEPDLAARLTAWLRLRPVEVLQRLPLAWVGLNAVEIEQTRSIGSVVIGESDGSGDQELALPVTSVIAGSLELEVEDRARGFEPWTAVDDLATHRGDMRVYVLDAEAGTVRFGDGIRGQVPELGSRVRVRTVRAGGGAAGNLPAGTLASITGESPEGDPIDAPLVLAQPLPTRGGVDAERLVDAERRIPATLRHRNRAVTADDFRTLAAATPGVQVGRVELLPRFKPHQRRTDVAGVVSVMVLPDATRSDLQPPAPRPDRPFLEAVHGYLDERRSIGTELYVIGTEYIAAGVAIGIDVRDGFEREETIAMVRRAVRAFLWPLAPGGADGQGWPLGRTVLAPHIEVAVARVTGVAAVRGVSLFARRNDDWELAPQVSPGTQGIRLDPWQLPELKSILVVAGGDAPGDLRAVPNPFRDAGVGVAIPVVPEVC
jgi:hypothetical protein